MAEHNYLDLVTRIPLTYKEGRKFQLDLIKALNPDLLKIPYHSTMVPLNASIKMRQIGSANLKQHEELALKLWQSQKLNAPFNHYFTNFSEWFRANPAMRNFVNHHLLTKDCRLTQQFIKPEWINRIVNEHFNGEKDHRSSITYLLSTELFLRQMKW